VGEEREVSFLTENPAVMMEAVAVLVRRAGGSVTINLKEEAPGPFTLLSKIGEGKLYLVLEEGLSEADIHAIWTTEPDSKP
jgi:hypothetical protein